MYVSPAFWGKENFHIKYNYPHFTVKVFDITSYNVINGVGSTRQRNSAPHPTRWHKICQIYHQNQSGDITSSNSATGHMATPQRAGVTEGVIKNYGVGGCHTIFWPLKRGGVKSVFGPSKGGGVKHFFEHHFNCPKNVCYGGGRSTFIQVSEVLFNFPGVTARHNYALHAITSTIVYNNIGVQGVAKF